ncbi:moulting cycle domain-containing protein [Ditylenchus destructor]|uniref:Moulting cycle domain-containing protein n=1 Tax=Ditylenchus destructor TaxID=166010 RepID=A0AAD4MWL6_9BILA|nr:moulting cycle domain-containing protein [Ditylenchus destructor]
MHSEDVKIRRRRKSHFVENEKYRIFWTLTRSPFGLCAVTFCTLVFTATCVEGNGPDYTFGGKVQNIPMTTEHGLEMVQHWMDNMLGSFIATFGDRKFLKKQPRHVVEEFGECNKKAANVPEQAKCLSRLMKNEIKGEKYLKKFSMQPAKPTSRFEKYEPRRKRRQNLLQKKESKWVGGFRVKRDSKFSDVVSKSNYELMSPGMGKMTPFGSIAQTLLKQVLAAKNKTHAEPWQETIVKLQQNAKRRKEKRKHLEDESLENMDQFVFRGMRDRGMVQEDLETVFNDPKKLKRWLDKKRSAKSKDPMQKFIALLRQGLKIGYSLGGKNASEFDDKSLKVVSPRFLSVVPEEEEYKNETMEFLSPSLFSLHNKGKGIESLTSLPQLMKGFTGQDQQKWMDLIMEAAGVVDQADKLDTDFYENSVKGTAEEIQHKWEVESRTKDGTPLYFTRENVTKMFGSFEDRKIETFMNLHKNITKEQVLELNRTGYVMMTREQLDIIYGKKSPYNNSEALHRLSSVENSTQADELVMKNIHHVAQLKSFKLRQKDIVLSPITFSWGAVLNPTLLSQSFILSPVIFSPIVLSPAVLGPFILTPGLFVPVILSPRVLSPLILTPLVFIPFVLSPVVLHPYILSPGIFNPIVLNPFVLSPLILSPQVFAPFVLSPLVLSPIILNPNVGSPLVLSPFVLSPIIWSPQALGALVLSPYALSPVIQSSLIAYSIVLSPSWLSK